MVLIYGGLSKKYLHLLISISLYLLISIVSTYIIISTYNHYIKKMAVELTPQKTSKLQNILDAWEDLKSYIKWLG